MNNAKKLDELETIIEECDKAAEWLDMRGEKNGSRTRMHFQSCDLKMKADTGPDLHHYESPRMLDRKLIRLVCERWAELELAIRVMLKKERDEAVEQMEELAKEILTSAREKVSK